MSEVGETRKRIKELILGLPEGTMAPTFASTWEKDGALIICCANQQLVDWLKDLSAEIRVGNTPLHAAMLDELLRRHRVVVYMGKPDLTSKETIKLLDRQNTGLGAREWVVGESTNRDALNAHFLPLSTILP